MGTLRVALGRSQADGAGVPGGHGGRLVLRALHPPHLPPQQVRAGRTGGEPGKGGWQHPLTPLCPFVPHRALKSSQHSVCSVTVVDTPGAQNPELAGQSRGATFEELCHNYAQERLQLLFHQRTFARELERYKEVTGTPGLPSPPPLLPSPLCCKHLLRCSPPASFLTHSSSGLVPAEAALTPRSMQQGFPQGSRCQRCLCRQLRSQPGSFACKRARLGDGGVAVGGVSGEDRCCCSISAPTTQGDLSMCPEPLSAPGIALCHASAVGQWDAGKALPLAQTPLTPTP